MILRILGGESTASKHQHCVQYASNGYNSYSLCMDSSVVCAEIEIDMTTQSWNPFGKLAVFEYKDIFYNNQRLNSSNCCLPPNKLEKACTLI
jgi:hypothetical protein